MIGQQFTTNINPETKGSHELTVRHSYSNKWLYKRVFCDTSGWKLAQPSVSINEASKQNIWCILIAPCHCTRRWWTPYTLYTVVTVSPAIFNEAIETLRNVHSATKN